MIFARVDDRLVHGQVIVGWVPYLHAVRIDVVSDRLAADELQRQILAVAGGAVPVQVLGSAAAAAHFTAGDYAGGSLVLLLFESLADARRAREAGVGFETLNIGGLRHDEGRLCLREGITLDSGDLEDLRALRRLGVEIEVRLMPHERACPLPAGMG